MSIVAYCGLQGSGKTYEVVSEVVLSGVRAGRRIVTNVQGLNVEAIAAHVLKAHKEKVEPQIVVVKNADIESGKFFYFEREGGESEPTTCRAGDLVIIDEAWRFWSSPGKWPDTHQIFFREHRHYTDADGRSSDLVLITQAISDLDRKLRTVVERTFVTRKLKELGLRNGYTVFQFEKGSDAPRALLQKWVKRYHKDIFALYSSYSAGQGAELAVDRRESFFGSSKIWWRAGFVVAALVIGLWGLKRFFTPPVDPALVKADQKKSLVPVARVSQPIDQGNHAAGAATRPGSLSMDWRQAGYITQGGELLVIVRQSDGQFRYVRNPDYSMVGRELSVTLDGQIVTSWSGAAASALKLPVGSK